jgi:hypothetical protein
MTMTGAIPRILVLGRFQLFMTAMTMIRLRYPEDPGNEMKVMMERNTVSVVPEGSAG